MEKKITAKGDANETVGNGSQHLYVEQKTGVFCN